MSFVFDIRPSDSPFIDCLWHTHNDQPHEFTSQAGAQSEIVISRVAGETTVTVRGPETRASIADVPADAEFFGIVFKLGTFMPHLLPRNVMDRRDAHLPAASKRTFWLDSAIWEIPNFDNADVFVEHLVRYRLLAHDRVVSAVLRGEPQAYSPRALQYRFVRATGLPRKIIQQIDHAQQALVLLQQGRSIIDTAHALGYFDQSHLTNALKRFVGKTPAQIARLDQTE